MPSPAKTLFMAGGHIGPPLHKTGLEVISHSKRQQNLVQAGLRIVQATITSRTDDQLLMASLLDDLAAFKHENLVGMFDR